MSLLIRSALNAIEHFYGDRKAKRSGVPLINHIHEGLRIMEARGASEYAMAAFALHPIFQNDHDLAKASTAMIEHINPVVMALVMEYRSVANAWLSDQVYWKASSGPKFDRPPKLSPLPDVNEMLVADKVQNRADFILHHKHKHERSQELDLYFNVWLAGLGIGDDEYERLVRAAKKGAKA